MWTSLLSGVLKGLGGVLNEYLAGKRRDDALVDTGSLSTQLEQANKAMEQVHESRRIRDRMLVDAEYRKRVLEQSTLR